MSNKKAKRQDKHRKYRETGKQIDRQTDKETGQHYNTIRLDRSFLFIYQIYF